MTLTCELPDARIGVALRLSTYLDCQGRALGENGFQALVGGPVQAGLLSGLVTIFVALIGYRLILGHTPSLRDGVSWAVRLGLVLTLTTSWPAFQTLVYRVTADGPGEIAAVLLPASGLPAEGLNERVQAAYDTMRLGAGLETSSQDQPPAGQIGGQAVPPSAGAVQPQGHGPAASQFAVPQTASAFVISTSGVAGGLRVAIGFLLAVAPLAILALLFDTTLSVFSGWVRALVGTALALIAAIVVTAIDLVQVESELAHIQSYSGGGIYDVVDPQGLTTIVLSFAVVMLVTLLAASRMASAFKLPLPMPDQGMAEPNQRLSSPTRFAEEPQPAFAAASGTSQGQTRVGSVTEALALSVRRDQALVSLGASAGGEPPSRRMSIVEASARTEGTATIAPLGVTGRRSTGRRSRSAATRDRVG